MTVLVTGAGHVGVNLIRALLAAGRRVRALVYREQQALRSDLRALEGLDVEIVPGDICDPESLRRAFESVEVVYHTAAYISIRMDEWPRLEAINICGTRNVVETSLRYGARRLVYFSSIHALQQEPLDAPVDESRPRVDSPRYPPYDRSKAAAEQEVQKGIAQGLDAVVVNPTGIIGPYDFRPSFFGEVLLSLVRRKLPVLVESGFDWVDARDVAEGALRAEARAKTGATYLLSGHWVSMRELAATLEEVAGVRAPRLSLPMGLARLGAPFATLFARLTGRRPLVTSASLAALRGNRHISHARATRELGYHPRPFRTTIVDTLQWFTEAGMC